MACLPPAARAEERADVDFGDLLDYLALDPKTHAILLYVEAVTNARKFMTAGRIAARTKPVIVVKAGRGESGAKAAVSHSGALAGSDMVYDAAFRRAGMLRVAELRDLFAAAETLASGVRIASDRLAVLTNGGGLGVIAADAVERAGGMLATLSPETAAKLDMVLPRTWSRANPVDIVGDATGERYAAALDALLGDEAHNPVLVINCPTAIADSLEAAEAVVTRLGAGEGGAPVLTAWLGEPAAQSSRRLFASHRVPTYETPEEAARAFMQLVDYRRNQELLMETPPAFAFTPAERRAEARGVVRAALDQKRTLLSEAEAKAVISAYGISTVPTFVAADAAEARRRAEEIAGPAVLKILSPDITHKSDIGGVRLDLRSPAEVEAAAVEMLAAVRARVPDARLSGFTVQPMIRRPAAQELIAGISVDATFGPVVLFGHGGTATEVIADRAIGLPPLNRVLARDLIGSTRVSRLLAGYRDRPPADLEALADVLCRLSEIAIDLPEVTELDINPLLADSEGSLALDARIVVRPSTGDRLAIHPYPGELEKPIELPDGTRLRLRPIRPEDEPALIEMVRASTDDDRRLRFLAPLNNLSHRMASRLTQIDYDREMAFVAAKPGEGGLLGVSRLIADPDNVRAEFAVMVRSDLKGRGLGYRLMAELIDHARRRGVRELVGEVLPENATMLKMAEELGFARSALPTGVVRVSLDIGSKGAA